MPLPCPASGIAPTAPSPSRRALLAAGAAALWPATARASAAALDVGYVPTPMRVASAMLRMAGTGPRDLVYDLGSGDGRIAILAASRFGARAVGVELDAERVAEARRTAEREKLGGRVRFVRGDLFEQDLTPATVITLFLLPRLNMRLRPTLLALRPGTRIVSHGFDMGDWAPDRSDTSDGRTLHLWTVRPT